VRNCLSKLTAVFAELQRQAKRENSPYNQENLPRLWILAPLVSETILNGFGAALDPNWPEGVYFLPPLGRTGVPERAVGKWGVGCWVWGVECGEVGKWGSGEVGKWGSGVVGRIKKIISCLGVSCLLSRSLLPPVS